MELQIWYYVTVVFKEILLFVAGKMSDTLFKNLSRKWFPFHADRIKAMNSVLEFRINPDRAYVVFKHTVSNNSYYSFIISNLNIGISIFNTEILAISHTDLFPVNVEQDVSIRIEYELTETNANRIKKLLANHRNVYAHANIKYITNQESFHKTIEPSVFVYL